MEMLHIQAGLIGIFIFWKADSIVDILFKCIGKWMCLRMSNRIAFMYIFALKDRPKMNESLCEI